MKHWGSALFPLTLLGALAALTFWLRYATELPEIRHDGKHRHDPDFIVSDATLRKIGPSGTLAYTLKAAEIHHYPDDGSSDLIKPDLVYLSAKGPTITTKADTAHASDDNERVDLYGNVRIERSATKKDPATVGTMAELTVFPNDEKAFTRSPVRITQGESWVTGTGLQMDYRMQTYVLESKARALLESRHAKK
ncbi:LPS export ABC transporter periplasmic protein LptC [Propionivibrio dicarboxylicus]|uniref:Lipopolysaccharide export system protein LptC n=1 Tax=Propionivibrio dicarboxylicus TaxID=83767 RepID=A0A1G8L3P1_9RHOO|nr:LPS export ABC transporter periplasmic protein LptC [Propionivibrio dicarboxylicus]SDI49780.1 lipopolysaccharide export system protein LptC [Propionivibrio dicarboxylicus]